MRPGDLLPLLWLCGPPGAGKSAAGWALYSELARSGRRAGFADIDQLGMCFPVPADDPQRYRLKARNLSAVAGNFRAAGCDALVVSGDLGSAPGISAGTIHGAALTVCRLRASPGELRRRLTSRGEGPDFAAGALRLAQELDRTSFADACVDTDCLTIAEVARQVRERSGGWPPEHAAGTGGDEAPVPPRASAGGQVMLLCGVTGVGKSTIGFRFFLSCLAAGLAAGYVDLRQVGFLAPAAEDDRGGRRLKARNLAAIWRNYQAAGATHLVASGEIDGQADFRLYAGELAGAELTVVRLRAGPGELLARITTRGAGGSWPEPGDLLRGQPAHVLAGVARQAALEAAADDGWQAGALAIDTTGRTPDESAGLIAAATGWLK